ncbi:MAG TPA: G1 family glutamic endopeptidase [Gaiellaceae bacterium]
MRRISFAFAVAAVVAVAVPALAAGSPARGTRLDPNHKITNTSSSNWSGYAAINNTFTSVSASWTQPSATCTSGETSYSSFWVGLDGYNSSTVEQTGTDADCSSGSPRYYAWYEMYPKFPVNLSTTSYPVAPNDTLTASVNAGNGGQFTLTISSSRGWTFTTSQRLNKASLSSAEVIAEAPSSRSGVLPLTNFGTVSFTSAAANGVPLDSKSFPFGLESITMASSTSVKAQPSSASNGAFSVTWKHS